MRRLRWIVFAIVLIIVLTGMTVFVFAPESTELLDNAQVRETSEIACLTDTEGTCLNLPLVSGIDVDNDAISFPDAFNTDYTLIVMPFDREQQVNAVTWLPIFEELSAEFDSVSYYNIAALPQLNAAIRFAVISGMSAGIRDDAVRDRTTILFLEEQERFLEALAIDDTETITILMLGQDGTVYYRDSGTYTTEAGEKLREAVQDILN